jgi:DNA-binding IclR family transcriptional regulator
MAKDGIGMRLLGEIALADASMGIATRELARRRHLSEDEVLESLEDLLELDWIEKNQLGNWRITVRFTYIAMLATESYFKYDDLLLQFEEYKAREGAGRKS